MYMDVYIHNKLSQIFSWYSIQFSYLEKLGCDSSCLLLNSKKEIFALGSSQGKTFLDNEVGMVYKFKSFFGKIAILAVP